MGTRGRKQNYPVSRFDPTRTGSLRRAFSAKVGQRFRELKARLLKLVVTEDSFGLKAPVHTIESLSANKYTFHTEDCPKCGASMEGDPDSGKCNRCGAKWGKLIANAIHEFASTQFNIDDPVVLDITSGIQSIIDPKDVVKFPSQTHLTLRYGLHPAPDIVKRVEAIVAGNGAIAARIQGLEVFKTPKGDVLKWTIDSPALKLLNRALGTLPNTQTYEYNPHITVAILKEGTAAKYLGNPFRLNGYELLLREVHVSTPDEEQTGLTINAPWRFERDPEKLRLFQAWLKKQLAELLLSNSEEELWRIYTEEGLKKGAGRAFDDTKRPEQSLVPQVPGNLDWYQGTREDFLRSSFGRPVAVEKVQLLASRSFQEMRGLTESMVTKMGRTLTDGLTQGKHPSQIARDLASDIDISRQRAETIARTEIIRAHAEGQLMAFDQLGVEELGVAVEWSTAEDEKVCPLCEPMEGAVFTTDEARGMIPRHPNCRCAWIPANVGEKTTGQLRSQQRIIAAVKKSKKRASKRDKWAPGQKISAKRPRSVLNRLVCNAIARTRGGG